MGNLCSSSKNTVRKAFDDTYPIEQQYQNKVMKEFEDNRMILYDRDTKLPWGVLIAKAPTRFELRYQHSYYSGGERRESMNKDNIKSNHEWLVITNMFEPGSKVVKYMTLKSDGNGVVRASFVCGESTIELTNIDEKPIGYE
jgi:hypothetical protein